MGMSEEEATGVGKLEGARGCVSFTSAVDVMEDVEAAPMGEEVDSDEDDTLDPF